MTVPDKLELTSMNITETQKEKLKELFPEVFTEGKIDFEKLKLTLGEEVDSSEERFGLTWAGKADCFKVIQEPSVGTLKPCRTESINWDTTENLFIEGDNLAVLKQLQKAYYGKVKMIYIDPPYNTGKEFIYPDKYQENMDTYLAYSGQLDEEGKKFSTNTETVGRFHSNWLSMMYPRLFLSRNLLTSGGVIFVSIADHELYNLKQIMNEIFGEENWIGTIIWKNSTDNNPTQIAVEHEYVVVYAKNKNNTESEWKSNISDVKNLLVDKGDELIKKNKDLEILKAEYEIWYRENKNFLSPLDRYKYIDFDGIYTGSQSVHNPGKEGYRYDIFHPVTGKPCKEPLMGYRFPEDTMKTLLEEGKIIFGEDENKIVELKVYAKDYKSKLPSILELDGRLGSYDLKNLFPNSSRIFNNPKPINFLNEFVPFVLDENDIILDFFSGSCSSAHATLELNRISGKDRKFIMVQLPEPTDEKSEAYKAGYKTIADIGKERIRRVIQKIQAEQEEKQKQKAGELDFGQKEATDNKLDLGFKVFKLDRSNFKIWDGDVEKKPIEEQLQLNIHRIDPDSSEEDLLYEILLKSGFQPTVPVTKISLAGKTVFSIADDALLICLEKDLTKEVIKAVAEKQPVRAVFLDDGFKGNDQLKTNAVQIMKSHDVKEFKTV
jgi:adenine-specific DNA-methyltransferase